MPYSIRTEAGRLAKRLGIRELLISHDAVDYPTLSSKDRVAVSRNYANPVLSQFS